MLWQYGRLHRQPFTIKRRRSLFLETLAWSHSVVVSIISTISITMAKSVSIAETISKTMTVSKTMTISKTAMHVSDRWRNRVSIVAVGDRWRGVSRSVSHLRDSRCGIRHFCDGRCNSELSDGWSYCDLKTERKRIISRLLFFFILLHAHSHI